jgi:CDP-diacylglycerol---serine O-phosphatidyltransferase
MIKKNIPNFFTLCNLFCGCTGIVFALEGNLIHCAYMVGFACVFDVLDGLVARWFKVSSEIGKQLDSMADMVSFGVVPGVLLYKMITCTQLLVSFNQNPLGFISGQINCSETINYLAMTGFLVTIFSAIRLANFNIDPRQSYSFIGLPTPANAILIASLPLSIPEPFITMLRPGAMVFERLGALSSATGEKYAVYLFLFHPYAIILLTLFSSFLLVSPIPLFAFKFKNISWKENRIRYLFLLIAPVLLILFKFPGIPLIIILYIVLSIIHNVTGNIKKQDVTPGS